MNSRTWSEYSTLAASVLNLGCSKLSSVLRALNNFFTWFCEITAICISPSLVVNKSAAEKPVWEAFPINLSYVP